MNATILNFLTTDGTVTVSFARTLLPPQYEQLYQLILGQHFTTVELSDHIRQLASEWGVQVVLDEC